MRAPVKKIHVPTGTPPPELDPRARRAQLHAQAGLGERAADNMAAFVGSWKFIWGQSIFIAAWITLNSVAFVYHWDPFPWILLNLCMSTQAMYASPFIMLSQNRQAAKDRQRDDQEAEEVHLQMQMARAIQQVLDGQNTSLDFQTKLLVALRTAFPDVTFPVPEQLPLLTESPESPIAEEQA